jgi:hypothetical protein
MIEPGGVSMRFVEGKGRGKKQAGKHVALEERKRETTATGKVEAKMEKALSRID